MSDNLVTQVQYLRKRGYKYREIAAELGISRSWASELIRDPTGEKAAAHKDRYGGKCEVCGCRTTGSDGRTKAPKRCKKHPVIADAPHGTIVRYRRGCPCDECRAANTAYSQQRRTAGHEPPVHGVSGYFNWGCRCDICKEAGSHYNAFYTAVRASRGQTAHHP